MLVTEYLDVWQSVCHLTDGSGEGQYGFRIPAIYIDNKKTLVIFSAVNENANYGVNYPLSEVIGGWIQVAVRQALLNEKV